MRLPFRTLGALCAALLAAPFAGACSRFERVDECRALAQTINPALTEIELIERIASPKPADYRRAASRYLGLSDEISRIQLHGDELPLEVRQYRDSIIRASELVRQAADRLEQGQSAQLDTIRRELLSLDQRQRQQTRRIEVICRSGGRGP